jgi:hypothetical protein
MVRIAVRGPGAVVAGTVVIPLHSVSNWDRGVEGLKWLEERVEKMRRGDLRLPGNLCRSW